MPVVAWSRSLTPGAARSCSASTRKNSSLEVAASADVVSVHVALKPETKGFIGEAFFAAMRPGAASSSTRRAPRSSTRRLSKTPSARRASAPASMSSTRSRRGGTGAVQAPIFDLPGVIGTHHIGASTDQAQEAIAAETVRIVREYRETGRAPNVRQPRTKVAGHAHARRAPLRPRRRARRRLRPSGRPASTCRRRRTSCSKARRRRIARIHMSSSPSPEVIESIRTSTDDIIEVAVLAL